MSELTEWLWEHPLQSMVIIAIILATSTIAVQIVLKGFK